MSSDSINSGYVLEDINGKVVRIGAELGRALPFQVQFSARTIYSLDDDFFLKSKDRHHLSITPRQTLVTWLLDKHGYTSLKDLPIGKCSWLDCEYSTEHPMPLAVASVSNDKTQFYCGPGDLSPFRILRYGNLVPREGGKDRLVLLWSGYDFLIRKISNWVREFHPEIEYVYGPPRGGLVLAVALSHHLNIKMVTEQPWRPSIRRKTLWVDDIYGTGETFRLAGGVRDPDRDTNRFGAYAVWVTRDPTINAWYGCVMQNDDWVVFPWETDEPCAVAADEADYVQRRGISHLGEQK